VFRLPRQEHAETKLVAIPFKFRPSSRPQDTSLRKCSITRRHFRDPIEYSTNPGIAAKLWG